MLADHPPVARAAGAAEHLYLVPSPESGTVLTGQMLARGLGMEPVTVSAGCSPRYSLDIEKLARFSRGGQVARTHADGSPENLQTIAAFADRWVVHIRDPRSVVLSLGAPPEAPIAERHGSPYQLLYSSRAL